MKKTNFTEIHRKLGAKLVEFAGFEMPVQYHSIINEHKAVRNKVGVFDVSCVSALGNVFIFIGVMPLIFVYLVFFWFDFD